MFFSGHYRTFEEQNYFRQSQSRLDNICSSLEIPLVHILAQNDNNKHRLGLYSWRCEIQLIVELFFGTFVDFVDIHKTLLKSFCLKK